MVGASPQIRRARQRIGKLAGTDMPVLLRGETGTGKELAARLIHSRSRRASAPFIAVNCAAIPHDLLESDLFGHEKGAFTGAITRRRGRFERAHGGTLFLDEIGDMSPALQAKLLRALQEGEVERVGSEEPIRVDVRVVAATHRDLERMMEEKEFRADLYYRLAGAEVELPPLREREGDVELLAKHFAEAVAGQLGRSVEMPDGFIAKLEEHPWPGNVRELANAVEHAVQLSEDGLLRAADLPRRKGEGDAPAAAVPRSGSPFPTLAEVEREHIRRALERAGGNRSEAARLLGIHRNTLIRKIRSYGL